MVSVLSLVGCGFDSGGTGEDLAFGADVLPEDASATGDALVDSAVVEPDTTIDPDGTTAPDTTTTPDTTVVDTAVPDTATPDTAVPPDTTVVDTAPPDTAPPCSEATGKMFGGHCYFMLGARAQGTARSDCAAVGAHIVTVTSTAEHDFLKTMGAGDRWIGLRAPSPSNDRATYVWVTGEAKSFDGWYTADPDNMGPCVAMHGTLQLWVDRACGDLNPAICERE